MIKDSYDSEVRQGKVILLLFFIGLTFAITLLIIKSGRSNKISIDEKSADALSDQVDEKDGSVSQYFESNDTGGKSFSDAFYRDDPFKEICAPALGDGNPNISSNTVCLR